MGVSLGAAANPRAKTASSVSPDTRLRGSRVRPGSVAIETRLHHRHVSRRFPQVRALRDVTPDMLEHLPLGPPLNRTKHVVSENMRVTAFTQAARQGNLSAMGSYLLQSHRSLKEDFEVSCPELDFLVESAMELAGVYGARMTGGGFGGCTVNLIDRASLPEFRSRIRSIYKYRFGVDPQVLLCEPAAGAGLFRI